jgi:DNA-binding NarL/FixJ family response regulator
MAGGTLLLSKCVNNHGYFRKRLETLGFRDVSVSDVEKDGLNMLINDLKPRIVLMSCGFYECSTPYMLGLLHRQFPDLNIACVSLEKYPVARAMSLINNGARSYVNFWDGADQFYHGIGCIKDGKIFIPEGVQEKMESQKEMASPALPLTDREIEVMRLVCNGFNTLEIADVLAISERTVYQHKQDLYRRLALRNENELIGAALCLGVVKVEELKYYGRDFDFRTLPGKNEKGKAKKAVNKIIRFGGLDNDYQD